VSVIYSSQVSNSAWSAFLTAGLGFTGRDYGLTLLFGTVLLYAGLVVYKKCLMQFR
jgi:hypothetical protein